MVSVAPSGDPIQKIIETLHMLSQEIKEQGYNEVSVFLNDMKEEVSAIILSIEKRDDATFNHLTEHITAEKYLTDVLQYLEKEVCSLGNSKLHIFMKNVNQNLCDLIEGHSVN